MNEYQSQPYQSYSNNTGDIDDIKKKLREIFNYYASYGDRLNISNLKSAKFHKMMQDAKIISNNTQHITEGVLMDKKRIDLIFCSVNKHKPNMAFENFL